MVRERVGDWSSAWRFALAGLLGWTTFQACSDYIAVDELPGLQLKGKSAETFGCST